MNLLKKVPLSAQLYAMAAVILISMGTLIALLVSDLHETSKTLAYTVENRMMPVDVINGLDDSFLRARDDAEAVIEKGMTPADAVAELEPLMSGVKRQWTQYLATEMSPDEKQLADSTSPHIEEALALVDKMLQRLRAGDLAGFADWRSKTLRPDLQALSVNLGKLADIQVTNAVKDKDDAAASYARILHILEVCVSLSLLVSIGVAFLIIRNTMRTLGADPQVASEIARRIAAGDLTFDVQAGKATVDSLVGNLTRMKDNLLHSKLDYEGQIRAISEVQAVIEFTPDGTIQNANGNFLKVMGYALDEIKGKHHRLFVDAVDRETAEYRSFWDRLGRGQAFGGQFRRISKSGQDVWVQGIYSPILDAHGKPFKVVKYATDVTAERQASQMNAAFRGALDKLGSNVVVADGDLNVIYVNESGARLMSAVESDFRKELPSFEAARLVGSSLDVLHKDAGGQRRLLAGLQDTYVTEMQIGGRTMRYAANPMNDERGRRLGTVVEWIDRTADVKIEAEVQGMVTAVTEGELDRRISLDGKTGAYLNLTVGLNGLVENVAEVVDQVRGLVAAANAGDLTRRLPLDGKRGLFVKIGSGINELTDNMATLVSQVKEAASEVHRGADEISQGNTNLSQRTEEQASSLEETASSMEQMTSTVKQNADNASQANQLAIAARDQAEKGGTVVASAVRAMTDINDSSKRIADIIGVIDEIAFQTNLLALNAAVEAARAGEQGRGFAVVATEVRNLAGRSATAAKEIKTLIQDSVVKVEEGSGLVAQSGATLTQIVAAVKKVTDIVAEIAAASQEQSAGIEQVNKAVMQLDELTQQNAALVEEASAASQSMADQARGLNEMMGRYRVVATGGTTATAVPAGERRGAGRPWSATARVV